MTDTEGYGDVAVSHRPAVPAVPVVVKPSVAQVLVVRGARIVAVVGLVALVVVAGYDLRTWHSEKVQAQADAAAAIRTDLSAVVARSDGHRVFAPAGWGAGQYPSPYRSGIHAWGTFQGAKVDVWQVPARAVPGPRARHHVSSPATPESLCRFTTRDVKAGRLTAAQAKRLRCLHVPGHRARVRVVPGSPSTGSADVRVALALREKGRYLNARVVDTTGSIRRHPVAWAKRFVTSLRQYDVTAYSVDDIYQGRQAAGWYGE